MADQTDSDRVPSHSGSQRLAQALHDKIHRMSWHERAAYWWSFEGDRLVNALRGREDRQPSILEVLAYETGDLMVRDDGYFEPSDEFTDCLTRASQVWPTAYALARHICIRNLAEGRLQASLQPLAALILSGDIRKPRPRPCHGSRTWFRDLLIVRGVSSTAKYGISPTRNDTSAANSGCDLVVEAFNRAGRRDAPTYQTVRKVWDRREDLLKDHDEIDFAMFARNVND